MEISEVRVRLVEDANDRLKAVCTVTLDDEFVVRDVKIVEGSNGLFVAMPSRKLTTGCPRCRSQNHLRARHCNECGAKLPEARIPSDDNGREKAHRDIAHPITAAFRQMLQEQVLQAYRAEAESPSDQDSEKEVRSDDTPRSRREARPKHEPIEEAEHAEDEVAKVDAFDDEVDEVGEDSEPSEVEESDDSDSGERVLSDYDALIADLKGGPKKEGRNGSDAGEPRGKPRSDEGSRRGGRGGRGGRGRGGRRGEQDTRTTSEEPRERKPAEPAEHTERPAAPTPVVTPPPVVKKVQPAPPPAPIISDDDDSGFGAGLFSSPKADAVAKPAPPVVETEPPPPARAPEPVADANCDASSVDEDEGFGAGLL